MAVRYYAILLSLDGGTFYGEIEFGDHQRRENMKKRIEMISQSLPPTCRINQEQKIHLIIEYYYHNSYIHVICAC